MNKLLVTMVIISKFVSCIILVFVHIEIEKILIMFTKYYPSSHNNKTESELISLITEPLSFDHNEQFSSIPIMNNEEIAVNEHE